VTDNSPTSATVSNTICTILAAIKNPSQVTRKQPQPTTEFLILSYKNDFEYLWALGSTVPEGLVAWITSGDEAATHNLVLVWDGMPAVPKHSGINIENYVTPYDWALAISCVVSDIGGSGSHASNTSRAPHLRILIVDLKSQEYASSFAHQSFRVIGHALPWVQFYRPLQSENTQIAAALTADESSLPFLRSAIVPGSLGSETFIDDVQSIENRILSLRQAQDEQDRSEILNSLLALWRSNLVRAGDRHNVGNLLAPLVLAQGLPKKLRSPAEERIGELNPLRRALGTLVDIVGLGSSKKSGHSSLPESGILQVLKDQHNLFKRRNNVRVLLIDDQYQLGYNHLLGYALFGKQYVPASVRERQGVWRAKSELGRLYCMASANCLFKILERTTPLGKSWPAPRVFPLSCDVLVLDLRLWTDKEGRRAFLERLVKISDHLQAWAINDEKLNAALSRAREIIGPRDQGRENEATQTNGDEQEASEVEALALMPLLLSYYDPSLPIMLFSSTHQRTLLASVSHRPNIITQFTKPILSGYGEDETPVELGRNLGKAFTAAIELHESRPCWMRAARTDWKSTAVFEIAWPADAGKVTVYNSSVTVWPMEQRRIAGGQMSPKLKAGSLRALLADHYQHYIEGAQYYDYASIPWETIEGSLIPDRFLDNPHSSNPHFSMETDLSPRNHITELLRHLRNKKTHGQAHAPREEWEKAEYRLAAIFAFKFLLDFLNDEIAPLDGQLARNLKTLSVYLRMRYPHLRGGSNKLLKPQLLTSDRRVTWLDFVAYTACFSAQAALSPDGKAHLLSAATLNALQELSGLLWRESWLENRKRIPQSVGNGAKLPATIFARDGESIYVEAAEGLFCARLPASSACRFAALDDEITIAINDVHADIPLAAEAATATSIWIELRKQRESPENIAAWFQPAPLQVEKVTRSNKTNRYSTRAMFSSHEEAHQALRQVTKELKRKVRFVL
jgi:hypothetical protein